VEELWAITTEILTVAGACLPTLLSELAGLALVEGQSDGVDLVDGDGHRAKVEDFETVQFLVWRCIVENIVDPVITVLFDLDLVDVDPAKGAVDVDSVSCKE